MKEGARDQKLLEQQFQHIRDRMYGEKYQRMGKPTFETEFYSGVKKKFADRYKKIMRNSTQKYYINSFDQLGWKDPFPADNLILQPFDTNFTVSDPVYNISCSNEIGPRVHIFP